MPGQIAMRHICRVHLPGPPIFPSKRCGSPQLTPSHNDPDKEIAGGLWNPHKYAEVNKLRDGLADCLVLLIEGEWAGA